MYAILSCISVNLHLVFSYYQISDKTTKSEILSLVKQVKSDNEKVEFKILMIYHDTVGGSQSLVPLKMQKLALAKNFGLYKPISSELRESVAFLVNIYCIYMTHLI